ncbi:MAG: hypothetical protein KC435_07875 [Thermomicrobiales bacterium]|nr:hypothetical protein [Thermomicrobiales bacterium]
MFPFLLMLLLIPTPSATPASSPYAAAFEDARSETTNPLQLEILADDVITADEYEASIQAFVSCMNEAGYDVHPEQDMLMPALYQMVWTYPETTPGVEVPQSVWTAYDTQFDDCYMEWSMQVAALYSATTYFPNDEDVFDANLACLHADKLVPESFDRAALEHAAMTGDWGPGVNPGTMELSLCLVNPFKIGIEVTATPTINP